MYILVDRRLDFIMQQLYGGPRARQQVHGQDDRHPHLVLGRRHLLHRRHDGRVHGRVRVGLAGEEGRSSGQQCPGHHRNRLDGPVQDGGQLPDADSRPPHHRDQLRPQRRPRAHVLV